VSDTPVTTNSDFYYGSDWESYTFYNTLLANSIALENHFSSLLFHNDLNRIIYSPNEFCFKERLRKNKSESNLNFPFMNYYLLDINQDTSPRSLWNNMNEVQGMLGDDYQAKLGYKLKLVPVTMEYEGTVFYNQPYDVLYGQQRIQKQASNETILSGVYTVPIASGVVSVSGTYDLYNPLFVNYSIDYNDQYSQDDWLIQNKILTIGLDIKVITYFIYSESTTISLSKEVIFNFISSKGTIDKTIDPINQSPQELLTEILDYDSITGISTYTETGE
jgi:hypothetical protein